MDIDQLTFWTLLVFSWLGLALTPAEPAPLRRLVPTWFLGVNLVIFTGFWRAQMFAGPLVFLGLSTVPAAVVCVWLSRRILHHPGWSPDIDWVGWPAFRLMGVLFFFQGTGDLPLEFLLQAGLSEAVVGAGALALWGLRPYVPSGFHRAALAWNVLGLVSALGLYGRIQLAFYLGHMVGPQREVTYFFSRFPEIWMAAFWIPLSVAVHWTMVFYGLRREWRGGI